MTDQSTTDTRTAADAHPVDVQIGQRLRQLRKANELSRKDLAGEAGLTPQQLQAYEAAEARIPASELFDIARALGADLAWFFSSDPFADNDNRPTSSRNLFQPDTLKLAFMFDGIGDRETRQKVLELLASLSNI